MSTLHDALTEYLATRRALGTELKWPGSSLRKFVDFVESERAEFVTTELALRWALAPVGVQRATHARRLDIVRGFAVWLRGIDPRTQIPPPGLLPARHRRPEPYIRGTSLRALAYDGQGFWFCYKRPKWHQARTVVSLTLQPNRPQPGQSRRHRPGSPARGEAAYPRAITRSSP